MALNFGSLGVINPSISGTKYLLYTAPSGILAEGKIYVSNKSTTAVRIRVGLSTGGIENFNSSGYISYEKEIQVNEYYESERIFIASGQSVIVSSNDKNVSFNLVGKETPNTLGSGIISFLSPTSTKLNQTIYTVPGTDSKLNADLYICNRNPFPVDVRVSIGGTLTEYIEYNYRIYPFETHQRTTIRVYSGEKIGCRVSDLNTNFIITGYYEDYDYFYGNVGIGSTLTAERIIGNSYWAKNSVGIGTSSSINNLDVVGNAEIDNAKIRNNLVVSGISTFAGAVTFEGGTINFGNSQIDNIVLNAEVASNVIPTTTGTYDLGSSALKWRDIYVSNPTTFNGIVNTGVTTNGTVTIGSATTALVVNGDFSLKGQIGIGTTTQQQIRYGDTNDRLEIYNKSLSRWMPILGVNNQHVTVTANYYAQPFQTLWIDTLTSGTFTIYLPPTPVQGDVIKFYDVKRYFQTNNLTIDRNGKPIMGDGENLVVSTEGAAFELTYYDTTSGWRFTSI